MTAEQAEICTDTEMVDAINVKQQPETQENIAELAEAKKDEANALYKKAHYAQALALYSEAIALTPLHATYYNNRAAALTMLCRFHDAALDCRHAVQLDPTLLKAHIRASKCYLAMGDPKESIRHIELAILKDPSNAQFQQEKTNASTVQMLVDSARVAMNVKEYRRCIFNLDRATQLATSGQSTPTLWKIMKAEALIQSKRTEEASGILSDILRMDTRCADAIFLRGLIFYGQGDTAKAVAHFSETLRVDPDMKRSRVMLKLAKQLEQAKEAGNEAFKAGSLQDAYNLYTQALEVDPTNSAIAAKLYSNRATVSSKLGNVQETINDCDRALDIDPEFFKVYLRRADCYMKQEKFEEAVRDYEKASAIDAQNREVKTALANAKKQLKMSQRKDYYKILNISKDATESEIKKAYRKLALIYHPDKTSEADDKDAMEAKFKDISEAYTCLSDPQKRRRFDSGADMAGGDEGGMGGADMNDIFSMFFQQQGGFGGGDSGGAHGHSHGHSHGFHY